MPVTTATSAIASTPHGHHDDLHVSPVATVVVGDVVVVGDGVFLDVVDSAVGGSVVGDCVVVGSVEGAVAGGGELSATLVGAASIGRVTDVLGPVVAADVGSWGVEQVDDGEADAKEPRARLVLQLSGV
jgi:hypothetical protein